MCSAAYASDVKPHEPWVSEIFGQQKLRINKTRRER